MTPQQETAMRLALEALELLANRPTEEAMDYADNAITALRRALEQPAHQEPKFVRNVDGVPCITLAEHEHLMRSRPQAREWVDLTDDEIDNIYFGAGKNDLLRARQVIAAFKEKNQ